MRMLAILRVCAAGCLLAATGRANAAASRPGRPCARLQGQTDRRHSPGGYRARRALQRSHQLAARVGAGMGRPRQTRRQLLRSKRRSTPRWNWPPPASPTRICTTSRWDRADSATRSGHTALATFWVPRDNGDLARLWLSDGSPGPSPPARCRARGCPAVSLTSPTAWAVPAGRWAATSVSISSASFGRAAGNSVEWRLHARQR